MPSFELSKLPSVSAARTLTPSDRTQIESRLRPAAGGSTGPASGISLELTGTSETATPPVDAERIAAIRNALRDGSYPLVPTKIVDAMIAAQISPSLPERS